MRTSEFHGKLWGTNAEAWADCGESTSNDLYNAVLRKSNILKKGSKLLDVGCGAGGFCLMARNMGLNVSGLDASVRLLSIAQKRLPQVNFRNGDLEELPYEDGSFDLVTGFNSFQFAGDIVNALKEAKRVTKNGGKIILTVWGKPEDSDASQIFSSIAPYMPPPVPTGRAPLYSDGTIEAITLEAELSLESIEEIVCKWKFKDEETALKAIQSAGLIVLAIQNAGEVKIKETISNAINQFRQNDGSYILKNTFICMTASVKK